MSIYRNKLKLNQAGVAPMVTIIVISAATLAIALNLAYLGNTGLETSIAIKDARLAKSLAQSCAEEVLLNIALDDDYTADSSLLSIGAQSCTISITPVDMSREIMVETNGDYQQKIIIKAIVATSSISINDWKEY